MKVYLDDIREAPEGWIRTKTVDETIDLLKTGKVTHLSLDHDLGPVLEVGSDVLTWIEFHVAKGVFTAPDYMYVHSANPPAKERMQRAIKRIRKGF